MLTCLKRCVVMLLVLALLWLSGLALFIRAIPQEAAQNMEKTDAIVVLTGGGGRLEYGLGLLAQHRARKLLVSGVGRGVKVRDLMRTTKFPGPNSYIPDSRDIIMGYEANDTRGNARETAAWMKREGFTSLRLVTANYHMPRSLLEFHYAMPGYTIIADPVLPERYGGGEWWHMLLLTLSEYHKYIASMAQHWMRLVEHPQNGAAGVTL